MRWGRVAMLVTGTVFVAVLVTVGSTVWTAWRTLPSVSNLVSILDNGQGSRIYDRAGRVVATLHGSVNRHIVPLSQISPNMQKAIVAIEDHNFYHNPGFDIRSILRAAIVDLIHGAPVQGASTITEQLAKDLYLSDEKTLLRKIREFLIGLELAHRYSKNQILSMYLNEVYYGNGAAGIYAASKAYFNESPAQLTVAQAAMLAGLPQAPSLYDPLVNYKLAKQRQHLVLQAMARYHDITQKQANQAFNAPLQFHPGNIQSINQQKYPYPWYVDHVINILTRKGYSMNTILDGGLKIYTALNPKVYTIAQNAVDHWMNVNFGPSSASYPAHQAATVVENPKNGHVWAIIGGRTHTQFLMQNLATNNHRSSGSAIKPLLDYSPAIARGYTQMSVIQDVPIFQNIQGQAFWPANDNHLYRGYMDLRDALAISDNDVAIHLLNHIGVPYALHFANSRFDMDLPKSDAQKGLRIGIGVGTNVMQMTQAYAAFANQGVRVKPVFITKVVNAKGRVIYRNTPRQTMALSKQQAYIMTKMMERVLYPKPIPGIGPGSLATGYNLGIGRPAAGKTGTNNGEADAWFIGYEPQVVCGVWEGNRLGEISQNYTLSGKGPAYGDVAAGPIWQTIMQKVNQALNIPSTHFHRPGDLVYVPNVSITSGKLAGPYTPPVDRQGAWFIRGTEPTQIGSTHYQAKVSAIDPNLLWQPGCGPYVTSTFLRRESDWKPGFPLPWDSRYWAPTALCQPGSFPGPSSPHQNREKHHKKHGHGH